MDKKELQKKIKHIKEEIENIQGDIASQRNKGYSLSELYGALNANREHLRFLKEQLRKCDVEDTENSGSANEIAKTLTRQGSVNIRPKKNRDYSRPRTRKSPGSEELRIVKPISYYSNK